LHQSHQTHHQQANPYKSHSHFLDQTLHIYLLQTAVMSLLTHL
jgi:hypothetical protein